MCLLLSGNRTAASCGDYVHVRNAAQPTAAGHDSTPLPADSPCAHGRCEKAPFAPPAPEPTAPTGGVAHDAVLATVLTLTPPAGVSHAAAAGDLPSRLPSVPFHPPRA